MSAILQIECKMIATVKLIILIQCIKNECKLSADTSKNPEQSHSLFLERANWGQKNIKFQTYCFKFCLQQALDDNSYFEYYIKERSRILLLCHKTASWD